MDGDFETKSNNNEHDSGFFFFWLNLYLSYIQKAMHDICVCHLFHAISSHNTRNLWCKMREEKARWGGGYLL